MRNNIISSFLPFIYCIKHLIPVIMKKSILGAASVAVLLLLLLAPRLAFSGAQNGLVLWSQTVLPTLLPFMICSNVIVALGAVNLLTLPFRPLLHRVLRLSEAGSYVFVSGLLCGYPMGAKTCSEFLEERRISPSEAKYLLSVCNHPSPMFLLGYVASCLSGETPVFLILLSLYLPILPLSLISRRVYHVSRDICHSDTTDKASLSFDQTMMKSIEVMVKIGGYIMLFSILAKYVPLLPIKSAGSQAFLLGIVEITTGIQSISMALSGFHQALAIVAITAFGGLSGIFQTKSVLPEMKNAGLSIRHYIFWKLLHSFLSCIIFILLWQLLLPAR